MWEFEVLYIAINLQNQILWNIKCNCTSHSHRWSYRWLISVTVLMELECSICRNYKYYVQIVLCTNMFEILLIFISSSSSHLESKRNHYTHKNGFLRIRSHLLKKFLMENFTFCAENHPSPPPHITWTPFVVLN